MDPVSFAWHVDQDGYTIACDAGGKEIIVPRGGPLRVYSPLADPGLWLRFAHTCRSCGGALEFSKEFGLLTHAEGFGLLAHREQNSLGLFLRTAARLGEIGELLDKRDSIGATRLFIEGSPAEDRSLPLMYVAPLISPASAVKNIEYRLIPYALRDALLHQAVEAITGNRRFRRCRNEGCPIWIRLGPSAATDGMRRQTITERRAFCSDRCRVAAARRLKKEGAVHA
jgi:hypothetical protein